MMVMNDDNHRHHHKIRDVWGVGGGVVGWKDLELLPRQLWDNL